MRKIIEDIAAGAQEQASGITQVESAIGELNNVTQMNAAAAQETAANGSTLQNYGESLKTIAISLNQVVRGEKHQSK